MFHLEMAIERQNEAAFAYAEACRHMENGALKAAAGWQRFAAKIHEKVRAHLVLAEEEGEI